MDEDPSRVHFLDVRWSIPIAAGVIILGLAVWGSPEYNTSICVKTGMRRFTQSYCLVHWNKDVATPLSQVLTRNGYRDPNDHEWVYEHGGGRFLFCRRYCALGEANSFGRIVDSPKVALAVQLMMDYTDKPIVEKWVQWIFDAKKSDDVMWYLTEVQDHTNKQAFVQWLQERETEMLTAQTNR